MRQHKLADRARELAASGRLDDTDAMTVRALTNQFEKFRAAYWSLAKAYIRHMKEAHRDNT